MVIILLLYKKDKTSVTDSLLENSSEFTNTYINSGGNK